MFLLYDFEVFEKDWLVVFKPLNQQHVVFINDYEGVKQYVDQNKKSIFVGFNNRHYDDHILKAVLSDLNPKKISNWIIEDGKYGWNFPGLKKIYFNSLDLKQDIEGALGISLKEIESNLGLSIEESTVDFLIDRKLTDQEIEEVVKYCKHDVDATEQLFGVRYDYVKSRLQIINSFNLPLNCLGKTNAQLDAEVMQARPKKYSDGNWYEPPVQLQLKDQQILNFYSPPLDKSISLNIDICGVPHKLGFGGLHGALDKVHFKDNVYNFDVSSYYPSLILKYNFMSRNVPNMDKYQYIYNQRMEWKASGDSRQNSFKLILNTLSGAIDNEHNKLYDPRQCNQIRITGQLFLLDLLEKLKPYITLIQSNTDGIMFQSNNLDECKKIVAEWEQRTDLVMECDRVKEVYQKDVNNYVLVDEKGNIKTKGAYVKNYSIKKGKLKLGSFTSNSMTILDEAIVKYLLFNTPIEDTINKCDDPIRFQITTKKGPTYKRVEWEYDGQRIITNNVNRVFATNDKKCGKLYKIKKSGRVENEESDNKISSLPDNCLVFNKDLKDFDINLVNKQWYIKTAQERVNDFIGG